MYSKHPIDIEQDILIELSRMQREAGAVATAPQGVERRAPAAKN